jgi:CRP-like cAMP-binding protein
LSNYPPFRNHILAKLSIEDLELLRPSLQLVQLDQHHILEIANQPVKHVYFAESGFASVVAKDLDNRESEVGIVGREGVTGISVVLGDHQSPNTTYVQVAGAGHLLSVRTLRDAMKRSRTLQSTLLRYAHAMVIQITYTALTNTKVKLEARLARWLLMAHDRADNDWIDITHEFLALLLGARRAGVTGAVQVLAGRGLIRATRGRVTVLDRHGLERAADGSYGVPEAEYTRLMGEPDGA